MQQRHLSSNFCSQNPKTSSSAEKKHHSDNEGYSTTKTNTKLICTVSQDNSHIVNIGWNNSAAQSTNHAADAEPPIPTKWKKNLSTIPDQSMRQYSKCIQQRIQLNPTTYFDPPFHR